MKHIILTGGGTAGHVTPNIALIPALQEKGYKISYIGSYNGIEKQLIEELGIPYYGIASGKLRRYFDLKNFSDPFRVIKGYFQAKSLMKKLKPDVVFSKGGFVTVPVVIAAGKRHIPAIIHESDMTPGLANKLCLSSATKVCCNFPETVNNLPKDKAVLTGTPIRQELLHGNKEHARAYCGFTSRPRRLSASGIDLLIQDPYSVFAKYILKLYPLDDLDKEPNQRDYGTLVHAIIEEFNNIYPGDIPENIQDILLELGKKHFQTMQLSKELEAFWRPKFEKTAEWIAATEKEYRGQVRKVNNETNGEITYQLPGGDFTFTAKADRIDVLKDGSINIIDYKTGKIPSKKQVMSGHALQLPLEGLIASKGGFTGIINNKVQKLIYWQLGSGTLEIQPDEEDILAKSEETDYNI